jgi:amidase
MHSKLHCFSFPAADNNFRKIKMDLGMKQYQAISAKKKAQQYNNIPETWRIATERFQNVTNVMDVPLTCGLLSETESKITSDYDATALLEKLKARVLSAEQVTVAFCKRAAIAHQLVSPLSIRRLKKYG